MFRVKTTFNLGCEQIERVIEVDDIQTLSAEEKKRLFDMATVPLTIERKEDERESTEPVGRVGDTEEAALIEATPTSYTLNLVEHRLFEKDFYIQHKLEALRILHGGEDFRMQQSLLVKSLMSDLGIDNEEWVGNTSEDS
jgi:hypothetical protein